MVDISVSSFEKTRSSWALVSVFTLSIFLSATLLFSVQPLFAKLVLPLLGGSSSVWNTAMVFFQGTLLGGYIYAHLISKYSKTTAADTLPCRHFVAWAFLFTASHCLRLDSARGRGTGILAYWIICRFCRYAVLCHFCKRAASPALV